MEYYKNLSLEDLFYIDDDGLICCEEWRDIPDYIGLYQASNLGRFKSFIKYNGTNERILSQSIAKKGYLRFGMSKYNKKIVFQSHRIIAEIFIPNPNNLPEVNHIGVKNGVAGNKKDNRAISLEWSSHDDNIKHALENNLFKPRFGELSGGAKLTEKDVLQIRIISKYNTQISIAKLYNVNRLTISNILHGKTWSHI